jgi:hypothetical protein
MANPTRLISINDYQIFNTPISKSNSPRSDVSTLPETTIFHIPPEITDQILTYHPREDKACFIIGCSHFYTRYQFFFQDERLRECRQIDMSGDDTLTKRPKIIFWKGAVNIRLKLNYSGDWKMRTWNYALIVGNSILFPKRPIQRQKPRTVQQSHAY